MKAKNHIVTIAALAILVAPTLVYASWWNPFTWFRKTVTPPPKIIQIANTTSTRTGNPVVKVATSTASVKKETPKATVPQPTKSTVQSSEIETLRKEVEELKKTQPENHPTPPQPTLIIPPATQTPVDNTLLLVEKCKAKRDVSRGTLWPTLLEITRLKEEKLHESRLEAAQAIMLPYKGTMPASDFNGLIATARISDAEHEKNLQTATAMMEGELAKEYADCLSGN